MSADQNDLVDAKRMVLEFFELAFVQRRAAEAARLYLGTEYIQHNPTAPTGAEIFPELIGGLFAQAPDASFHLKRAIAEGDHVVLHYHMKMFPDDLGHAVVDIFRVENGKIVEHWDVIQSVPAESANSNGMF